MAKDENHICKCHNMHKDNIKSAIDGGATSLGKVIKFFGIPFEMCSVCKTAN